MSWQIRSTRGKRVDKWVSASANFVQRTLGSYFSANEALKLYLDMLDNSGAIVQTKDYKIRHIKEEHNG